MFDRFQGDPRLVLTVSGSSIVWNGGQPVMDQGIENFILISLFTDEGWVGNILFTTPEEKIGSKFIAVSKEAITVEQQNRLRNAALDALDSNILGPVDVVITNPSGQQQNIIITVEPPAREAQKLLLIKNGANWFSQKLNPASERI